MKLMRELPCRHFSIYHFQCQYLNGWSRKTFLTVNAASVTWRHRHATFREKMYLHWSDFMPNKANFASIMEQLFCCSSFFSASWQSAINGALPIQCSNIANNRSNIGFCFAIRYLRYNEFHSWPTMPTSVFEPFGQNVQKNILQNI